MVLNLVLPLDSMLSMSQLRRTFLYGKTCFSLTKTDKNLYRSFCNNIICCMILTIVNSFSKLIMIMLYCRLLQQIINIIRLKKSKLKTLVLRNQINDLFICLHRLHIYWKCGRNLLHPKGYEYRFSSLKNGKLSVVAMLSELPPSRHDPQSFSVDLTLFTVSY